MEEALDEDNTTQLRPKSQEAWKMNLAAMSRQCPICNKKKGNCHIPTQLPSAVTSIVCAHFQSFLYCMWTRCLVVIIACARSIFAAEAIQAGLNGSQLTLMPSVLVKWHANTKEF